MTRADGHQVSTSTVQRALRRRGRLLPTGFRADRRSWARLRKRAFAVIDYATKYCLAATVTPTSRGQDALGCLRRAVVEAERVLDLDDLRADRGVMAVVDADDYVIGEAPAAIAVVTDNGPGFRGVTFADAFAGEDPLFRHAAHGEEPTDQRRGRAVRHAEVRTSPPRHHRRRQRPRRRTLR